MGPELKGRERGMIRRRPPIDTRLDILLLSIHLSIDLGDMLRVRFLGVSHLALQGLRALAFLACSVVAAFRSDSLVASLAP